MYMFKTRNKSREQWTTKYWSPRFKKKKSTHGHNSFNCIIDHATPHPHKWTTLKQMHTLIKYSVSVQISPKCSYSIWLICLLRLFKSVGSCSLFFLFFLYTSFGEDTRSVFPIVSHILDYAGDMFKTRSSVQGISCNLIVRWIERDVWFWVR